MILYVIIRWEFRMFTEPAPDLYQTYAGIAIVYSVLSFLCSFRLSHFDTCYYIGETIIRYDGSKEEACFLAGLSGAERIFSFEYIPRAWFDPIVAVCRILLPQHDLYPDLYVELGETEKADQLFKFTDRKRRS